MPVVGLGADVFDVSIDRMVQIYEQGHTVVVSFSGGKDSTICLEICRIAAHMTGRLPVIVAMRDEEIMFPGTFEYCERVAEQDDIDFHWIIANQPVVNVFNRQQPYFWVFDTLLDPEDWVRKPPEQDYVYHIPEQNIQGMIHTQRFPVAEGKELYAVIGLRVSESPNRKLGLFSSRGHVTKPNAWGVRNVRPIYDWVDGAVWKAIRDNGWDYNAAYNTMVRMGMHKRDLRIAPPTLSAAGLKLLKMASQAWPGWFDRVARRLPGVRTAVQFGRRSVEPIRRTGETWEECFWRTCVEEAPEWIAERAKEIARRQVREHSYHSTAPLPQANPCPKCRLVNSWKNLAKVFYLGDPFCLKQDRLPYVEPEFFRDGAGKWGGKPTW